MDESPQYKPEARKDIEIPDKISSRLGSSALALFGRDNAKIRAKANEIAALLSGPDDVTQISAHFDQIVPAAGLSPLDRLLVRMLRLAPDIAVSLPFLKKRIDHINKVIEIAMIFDGTRLRHIREALENYHEGLT